ncbi:uncharacterized protein N7477_003043 [Penicillium maclennaniae]|uniref:uncharacterized protein n=1 Tax=Penicillium maclennaniae TaxID=1343394 RepID=UPI0025420C52|nr:uncharacterized protein N7477_003043 [Penicillium maclennaniae]KAJ5677410.1 hypothetical protein N7477_003043 [Penicillium maclennaniae]
MTELAPSVLSGVCSVGLTMIYCFIGYLLSQSTLSLYLKVASCFPSRSGAEVLYLEQAFLKPHYFFLTIFTGETGLLLTWEQRFRCSGRMLVWDCWFVVYYLAVGGALPLQLSLQFVVWFGTVEIATLLLYDTMIDYCENNNQRDLLTPLKDLDRWLGGSRRTYTSKRSLEMNCRNAWEGTSEASAYGATNAKIKLIFFDAARLSINLPRPEYRAWNVALACAFLANLYVLVAPGYPPTGGADGGYVGFWYFTNMVVDIAP